ncbi:MAG: anti-sigma factor domain-containing protein [Actinomycetota bacterium]
MDHGQLEETVASYALGALDDAERREVEGVLLDHLAGCDSCRHLLSDFREVVGDLALVAGSQSVPDSVERQLMERIRGDRPATQAATQKRPAWWIRGVAAAAIVAVAGLGAWTARLGSDLTDARNRTSDLARALTLIGSPDAETVRLTGERGALLFAQRPGEAVLVARDLLAPADGYVLQLWLMRGGVPTDAGVFVPEDGVAVLALGHDATGYDAVAVTVERAPGARAPSGAPIYSASLTT